MIYELSTNKHALLSNIELRTMGEGSNSDAGLRIVESEVELEERRILRGGNLVEDITAVTLTAVIPNKNDALEKGVLISGEDSQAPDNLKSPTRSFLSLSSEQNSEGEENDPLSL